MKLTQFTCLSVAVLMVLTGAAQAGLQCEIGLLTPATLAGNNPATGKPWKVGDQYRFVFLTSTKQRAYETNISLYDNLVQTLANASTTYPIGTSNGVTWRILGSTSTVDARDHTKTNPFVDGTGCAIFLLNGSTVVATNNLQLWSAKYVGGVYSGGLKSSVNLAENGGAPGSEWPYTGTRNDGTKRDGSSTDRAPLGGTAMWGQGYSGNVSQWVWRLNTGRNNEDHSFYALSDPLTIKAPETVILIR